MFGRKRSSGSSVPSPSSGSTGKARWRPRGTSSVYESSFDGSTREEALRQIGNSSGLVLPGEDPHDIIEIIEVRDA